MAEEHRHIDGISTVAWGQEATKREAVMILSKPTNDGLLTQLNSFILYFQQAKTIESNMPEFSARKIADESTRRWSRAFYVA